MRALPCLGFLILGSLGLTALVACGSSTSGSSTSGDGGASAASPTSCVSAMECNPQQCVCNDGDTTQAATVCAQGSCVVGDDTSFCATACGSHGGVSTIRPSPNVAASAECDAWCGKGAALACGSSTCDRFFFCGVPKGSCEAAARAALQCAVDKGEWACSQHGMSWSTSSSCPTFKELCTSADAGTD